MYIRLRVSFSPLLAFSFPLLSLLFFTTSTPSLFSSHGPWNPPSSWSELFSLLRGKLRKRKSCALIQRLFAVLAVGPQLAPFTFGEEAANAGEMATVQCAVIKGDLPVRIAWSLNGRRIDREQSHEIPDIVVTRSSKRISTLTIDSVAARHAGEYSCTATNEAGSATHVSVLSVNGTPRGSQGQRGGGERTNGWLVTGEGNTHRDLSERTCACVCRAFIKM